MLRRSHKKSRRGCLECKRRHVKCDEGRPVCVLCTMSGRTCRYACESPQDNPSTPNTPKSGPNSTSSVPSISPLAIASVSNPSWATFPNAETQQSSPALDEPLNMNHMELLIHTTLDKDVFSLGSHDTNYLTNVTNGLRISLESSYLLHQVLAFSARHLAFLHPERADIYLYQAVSLQTRAVSLFNASWNGIDESNCVAMLLFSSILGHHILADTLAKRDAGGLDAFMIHFVHCLDIQKGVHTIARTAWPLLMESELENILSWSSQYTSRIPIGNHCQQVKELINKAEGLTEEENEACHEAIRYLQVGFDAVHAEKEEEYGNRFHMIPSWILLVPPALRGLFVAKRREALVLLAYYALLLHHGRYLWQIGDAGLFILCIVEDYLGTEWAHWLKYLREEVNKTLLV
ncbi:C6 finger domain protein, putative [Talaromyces stipitatus ATCC 10500]|uniref:C6 finger domain protein, putative n=1 Tax=Talaromyces stipitatus (strain ATCC 10500 / CBS 375.48 / QM 6759 / NRRL 1006) TaxID=441959 RepID=B8MR93_TALSN|nr:C6 finger domain protein, putative [Talaromyces stipitatus ATCC 10500]EED12988.1 C6 finger domain protein, putative [Talaromyces stipitatus ATCC 10500]